MPKSTTKQRPACAWWIALAVTVVFIRPFSSLSNINRPRFSTNAPQHNQFSSNRKAPPESKVLPKACLAMIIKNEGPLLPRLFDSAQSFVSEYCIVDTGSSDDTIDVVKSMRMPGLIVEEPFVNFATTRNFMLDTCWAKTDCDYLVLLDADMVLKVSPEWDWSKIDNKDVYDMIQVSGIEYYNVRMLRRTTAKQVKVVGATHEYYDVPRHLSHKLLPKHLVYIEDIGDGNAKDDKFERDERLLRAEVEHDPNNTRAVFYLANTLKDQAKYDEAIPFYERRAAIGGWQPEVDYSLYMLSTCYLGLDQVDKAREYGEKAAFRNGYERAEPLYYLAYYLHRHEDYKSAWCYANRAARIAKPETSKALFIELTIYDYWIEYERASLCPRAMAETAALGLSETYHCHYCGQLAREFLSKNKHAPESLKEYLKKELKREFTAVFAIAQDNQMGLGCMGLENASCTNGMGAWSMRKEKETGQEFGGHGGGDDDSRVAIIMGGLSLR